MENGCRAPYAPASYNYKEQITFQFLILASGAIRQVQGTRSFPREMEVANKQKLEHQKRQEMELNCA
jgi:hypothetical protein